MTEERRNRAGIKQTGIVVVLLGISALVLANTVDVTLADRAGVVLDLPETVGVSWKGAEVRFCHECKTEYLLEGVMAGAKRCPECGSPLFTMTREEYEALPRDTQFVKAQYTNDEGKELHVAIVLSGQERNSIHRPQRCLVGQGFEIRSSRILTVPLSDDHSIDVMVLRTARNIQTPAGPDELRTYYAYWFVGQGRETPYHLARMFWLAWDRIFKNTSHKWAYISVSGVRGDNEETENEEIRRIIRELHKDVVLTADSTEEDR